MSAGSLRTRVALTTAAVLAAWVAVLVVGVNVFVGQRLGTQADDVLRARAQAAAATVQVSPSGTVRILEGPDDAAIDIGTWIFAGDRVLERPPGGQALDAQATRLVGRGQVFDRAGGGGLRWYAEPVRSPSGGQAATVVTSISLAPYRSTARLTLAGTAVFAVLLLGGGYVAVRAGVGRALRPVALMTRQAARWSADDVERRFGQQRRPAELAALAATLDGLLERLAAVLRHEQQLSAEISHELRTPLTHVLGEVELMRRQVSAAGGPPGLAEGLAAVEESARHMAEILETLMTQARAGTSAAPGRCDAAEVVRDLVARRAQSPPGIRMHVGAGAPAAGIDAAVLARALSPVLDNAARHARDRVDIHVGAAAGCVTIDIRDDGPGIAEDDLPHVFEPGWRAEPDDAHPGAGLGLALSRRLLEAAAGSVSASRGSGGGAVFSVRLPSA